MATKASTATIRCPRCYGSGRIELEGVMLLTFNALRVVEPATVNSVATKLLSMTGQAVKITALANRLETLRVMRAATRVRRGRWWWYSTAKQ